MSQEASTLRSWRERVSEAPKEGESASPEECSGQNPQNPQKDVFSPGGFRPKVAVQNRPKPQAAGQNPELPHQRLIQTGPNTWVEAEWCRALCVFCDRPAVDVIACRGHRQQMEKLTP
jgi:hypothetical protein